MQDTVYMVKQFNLKTGHVALATPFDVKTSFELVTQNQKQMPTFNVSGNFMADVEHQHFVAKN